MTLRDDLIRVDSSLYLMILSWFCLNILILSRVDEISVRQLLWSFQPATSFFLWRFPKVVWTCIWSLSSFVFLFFSLLAFLYPISSNLLNGLFTLHCRSFIFRLFLLGAIKNDLLTGDYPWSDHSLRLNLARRVQVEVVDYVCDVSHRGPNNSRCGLLTAYYLLHIRPRLLPLLKVTRLGFLHLLIFFALPYF